MNYKLISNAEDIAAAFAQFARALGVPDHGGLWKSHDGFWAQRQSRTDGRRDCVALSRSGADEGTVLISVRPDDPLRTKGGLIVVDEQECKYLAHSGNFDAKAPNPEQFRRNTQGDVEWIKARGDSKERYLITPLDGIDDADIIKNVTRFVRKRFIPTSKEDPPMVRPSLVSKSPFELNRILCGPPGTGKTYDAVSEAVDVIEGTNDHEDRAQLIERLNTLRDEGRIEFVTFHQNYAYEDFIEGIRPVLDKGTKELRYELRDGIFKQIAERARECPNEHYVLIIDEINRGNIAKIFGELITLIEPSKRLRPRNDDCRPAREGIGSDELRAKLPYSRDWFGVPDNLYLIGTMNTADRGIALLDVALRRRFKFIPRMPDANHDGISEDVQGVDCRKLLQAINDRIVENLDRDHQIGHTYFLRIRDLDGLRRVFQTQVVPLLQEYFYDDWEKIDVVLNNNGFITRHQGAERPVFDVLPADDDHWRQAESYKKIYRRQ